MGDAVCELSALNWTGMRVPDAVVIGCGASTMERKEGAMGEQSAEPIELRCAEPGCPEQVTYQRQELPGLAYDHSGGPKTVYLECPRGHMHRYQLGG